MLIPQKDIYFVRHAQEEYDGIPISGINEKGIMQARKTGEYLKRYRTMNKPFDTILTSPLLRAKETAKYIEETINTDNVKIIDDLSESVVSPISLKLTLKQLHKQDVKNTKDPIDRNRINDYIDWCQLNAEHLNHIGITTDTQDELKNRTDKIIDVLKSVESDKMVVVSHSKFLTALYKNMFNTDVIPLGTLTDDDKSWVSYVTYDDKSDKFRLVSPMDNSHLSL